MIQILQDDYEVQKSTVKYLELASTLQASYELWPYNCSI